MRQPFLRPPSGILLSMALAFLILVLGVGQAGAVPAIQIDFDPPSPSSASGLEGRLQGVLRIQEKTQDGLDEILLDFLVPPGPVEGATLIDRDFIIDDFSDVLFSFTGGLVGTDGTYHPVYVFPPGTLLDDQAVKPTDTEMIPICGPLNTPCRAGITDVTAPLYAFSTATPVGYIRARITEVPEPGTLLLLASGLAGIAVWRKFTA